MKSTRYPSVGMGESSWPQDEAFGLVTIYWDRVEHEPEDKEDHLRLLRADCARMEKFFASEDDAADLVLKFRAEVKRLSSVNLTE